MGGALSCCLHSCVSVCVHAACAACCPRAVQLEIQKLHRQRSGAMDQLTQEQKRLHASGMLLHSACGGRSGAAGTPAAIQSLTGVHLMR